VHRALSFLLDTNVISELTKLPPNANTIAWLGSVSATDLFGICSKHTSAVTLFALFYQVEIRHRQLPYNDSPRPAPGMPMPVEISCDYGN
jgi:predicted nucleic acid-binding protein